MSTKFSINNTTLSYSLLDFPFTINSFPRPYSVSILETEADYLALLADADFVILDNNIYKQYPHAWPSKAALFGIDATESVKNMTTVLAIIDAFIEADISKGSKVLAIGGGIIQDLAACSCALFRRGQPFIYLPTTSLGQLDSCVGAKCAMNTEQAKNIIGLFSAPSEVAIPIFMIRSMSLIDHRAGLAEMLRLCITASSHAVNSYMSYLPRISSPLSLDFSAYREALSLSLSIKKAVVDFDEYEKDIRRSMNFGHTFGHAIEKLLEFSIPHGIAVLLGMQMANEYSRACGLMSNEIYLLLCDSIKATISQVKVNVSALQSLSGISIIDQFRYDKKGDGLSVPLILITTPGHMVFKSHNFADSSELLIASIEKSLGLFTSWSLQ